MTNLLCPAIINPENVGIISDTPVSHIARFNLMQIGQIIQVGGTFLATQAHLSSPSLFDVKSISTCIVL